MAELCPPDATAGLSRSRPGAVALSARSLISDCGAFGIGADTQFRLRESRKLKLEGLAGVQDPPREHRCFPRHSGRSSIATHLDVSP